MTSNGQSHADQAAPLRRFDFALIYWLQLLGALSVSTMFSLLPSVGRIAGIPDVLIVTTQGLSATSWVIVASAWTRVAERRGRKLVIVTAAAGLVLTCTLTGTAIWVAVSHLVAPMTALGMLILARSAYGAIGLASGPAGQAFVVERIPASRRTTMLASLASAHAFGTVIGPAVAPMLTGVPVLGLAAPMLVVAGLAAATIPLLILLLSRDEGRKLAVKPKAGVTAVESLWRMPAMRMYLLYSVIVAVTMAGSIQTIGFLVIDTVDLSPREAQPLVGRAIACGAMATLAVQLLVVPLLRPSPRVLMIAGPAFAIAAMVLFAFQPSFEFIVGAAVLAYAGFAAARPGVAAASSHFLPMARQGEVAAAVLSTASVGIVAGPVMSMLLYTFWRPLPFMVMGGMLSVALGIAIRRPRMKKTAEMEAVGTE